MATSRTRPLVFGDESATDGSPRRSTEIPYPDAGAPEPRDVPIRLRTSRDADRGSGASPPWERGETYLLCTLLPIPVSRARSRIFSRLPVGRRLPGDALRAQWGIVERRREHPSDYRPGPGTGEPIMNELDIPCSDCGTDLEERTVPAGELPVSTDAQRRVSIAVCPGCGARYYPDDTLSRLANASDSSQPKPNS